MDEFYIGLMSGTSLNGVDAVVLNIEKNHSYLLCTYSEAFPQRLYTDLQQLITTQQGSLAQIASIDHQLAVAYSHAVSKLLDRGGFKPEQIKAIGCHGQTVFHQTQSDQLNSIQLGDPGYLAETTRISVVADFRRRDMAVGGQGAPLVPAFHAGSFASAQHARVILNIGGIANITVLPTNTSPVIGFDTGPGNTLLDQWVGRHLQQDFDRDGGWALSGEVIGVLLEDLLEDDYFHASPPKSTGREYFHLAWLEKHLSSEYRPQDVQATLLELSCQSIAKAISDYASDTTEVFVCGGGAHNRGLMQRLRQLLTAMRVDTTANLGIDPDWVEASAFAWLARQTLHQQPGNLTSVTGASRPVVLGAVYSVSG